MRKILLAALAALIVSPAVSAEWTMTCQNPRQSYLVVFDDVARTLVINPDTDRAEYSVNFVISPMVAGAVGHDSGLNYVADFHARQMVYYRDLVRQQTDQCAPETPQ